MSSTSPEKLEELRQRIAQHLGVLYPPEHIDALTDRICEIMGFHSHIADPEQHANHWDSSDVLMITYGDSVLNEQEAPLKTLHRFIQQRLSGVVSGVHILPFYPYSSDDGFSVIHYRQVNHALGDWADIRRIANDVKLMADLVINHCSAASGWFDNFRQGKSPGNNYFFEANPDDDLSMVVRPRTSPLLREVNTPSGTKHLWCTFSHDQVDLDFRNPEVLLEFVRILHFYLDQGVQIFRLDAIAFLWKVVGDPSINLPQTHEVVRLLRTLAEHFRDDTIIITETNIPSLENLSYFGNRNEAHMVYNFSLPPLLLNTLVTGDCQHLTNWLMSLPPAQPGTTYFNFLASHDGIGLRPTEGLLKDEEVAALADTMIGFGAKVSYRALTDGKAKPYEINISLFDALQGTNKGKDRWNHERFVCAHAIMLGLQGLPALYIHSLVATSNDYKRLKHTGNNRAINRHKWDEKKLNEVLNDETSQHSKVFAALTKLIEIRRRQSAFHPNVEQFALHLATTKGNALFGYCRQHPARPSAEEPLPAQNIFSISNISTEPQTLALADLNLLETSDWHDLISGERYEDLSADIELQPYQTVWISNN